VPIAADPAIHLVDRTFVDLPLRKLAEAALAAATGAGASFADFRFERLQTQSIGIRDTDVQSTNDAVTTGYAVRVIVDGSWGFAASIIPTTDDAAATATAIVAASIARAADHLPAKPATWIVAGGGARNPTLLSMLRTRLGAPVRVADEVGWSADAMEAQAFAFLAVRSLRGQPLTFPTTTGVPRPMPGGVIAAP
jgi:Predicted molecular chaperone distantly related to HSP70-fold metalloproteases